MTEEDDLRSKLDQTANTLADKVQILDARSKFVRLHRERQTNIETAKAVLGNCPDMCPEFERYFREENKQLSSLEMLNNEPDPHAMVKEYRRAGADQEEPLPCELRSPEVLIRTMDYLICNIVDRVEQEPGIVGDWYDFVWSRSRAIRKDITQQHLCDSTSVLLLEKCARFHIHCEHALIEEDASVFDSKINNENLVKCLQSLKDFYNDLNLKGTQSPNESEFRGYYLLLNLARPDILREVKLFHSHVRNSEPVQFALKCHYAMTTNNYIKFFDLVDSTTYLNACILHRYFYDIRLQAFKIMRKAYTISNQIEPYPISGLINQLGFENEDEVISFCESIELEYDNDSVLLKRGKTNDGRASIQAVRSRRLIERKRVDQQLSELINGGPLPENPYKKFPLHNSFDSNGRLKKDSFIGADRRNRLSIERSQTSPVHQAQQPPPPPYQPPQPQQSHQELISLEVEQRAGLQVAQVILNEFVTDSVRFTASKIRTHIKRQIFTYREAERIANSLINYYVNETIKMTFNSILYQMRAAENKAREILETLHKVSGLICNSLLNHHIYVTIRNTAESILNSSIADHNVRKCRFLGSAILNEVISEETELIVKRCFDELKTQEELIKYMRCKRSWRLAGQSFWHWRQMCLKIKRYRRIKSTFPASSIEYSPRIEPMYLKRKILSPVVLESSKDQIPQKLKKEIDCDTIRSEPMLKILKPKIFAEQVNNLSGILDPVCTVEDLSPIEKLHRKLDEEKKFGQTLRRSIETFRYTLNFDDDGIANDESDLKH
ncbi:germinal-center associated nuclear protein [Tetranychus urticae]|uniref:SAC3/GANP/THP3 conserved domain-containing protein n=1 Tax=Tetranychus urticae TaxID=32264 RepID=T1KF67_TETUR|nr:germinal-center associated nuclear protein [Tetranychus urticae]